MFTLSLIISILFLFMFHRNSEVDGLGYIGIVAITFLSLLGFAAISSVYQTENALFIWKIVGYLILLDISLLACFYGIIMPVGNLIMKSKKE